jgi:hypothetical protein
VLAFAEATVETLNRGGSVVSIENKEAVFLISQSLVDNEMAFSRFGSQSWEHGSANACPIS